MLILPGILHQEDRYTKTGLEDDVLVAVSDTGYSNDELGLEWLRHFERYSARRQVGIYRLLLLDGYGSHCTMEFITFCDEHKIVPFCLPPHSTHLLQPLDVVVFQPYKHYHDEAVDSATRTGCSDFNKLEFLTAITSIRRQTFKPSTIVSAFRKTGLIPYNPEIVLERLQEYSAEPRTPSPLPPQHLMTTPHTLRSLKRHTEFLETADLSLKAMRESFKKYAKGSLAQAEVGAVAQKELSKTKAAELARANRQNRTRRSVQKGGILYADGARAMVRKKQEVNAAAKIRHAQMELERVQKIARQDRNKKWKPVFQQLKRKVRERNARLKEHKKRWKAILQELKRKVHVTS
jgi:hypothetical protein